MAQIYIELDEYEDGLPTHGSYKVDALRMSIGLPDLSRDEHTAALLRIGAEILIKAANKIDKGEGDGEYISHLKIPAGDW